MSAWWYDKASRLSGALAFFTIFSLAPMLLIVIAVAGVLGEQAARGEIISQLRGLIGVEGARFVESVLVSARGEGTLAASVIGLATTFVGATAVFAELQDGLNTVWGVTPYAQEWIRISPALLQSANFVLSLSVVTLLFALIYRVLPDAEISWRDAWAGAAISAGLFSTGKFFIGLYLGNSSVGSTGPRARSRFFSPGCTTPRRYSILRRVHPSLRRPVRLRNPPQGPSCSGWQARTSEKAKLDASRKSVYRRRAGGRRERDMAARQRQVSGGYLALGGDGRRGLGRPCSVALQRRVAGWVLSS